MKKIDLKTAENFNQSIRLIEKNRVDLKYRKDPSKAEEVGLKKSEKI